MSANCDYKNKQMLDTHVTVNQLFVSNGNIELNGTNKQYDQPTKSIVLGQKKFKCYKFNSKIAREFHVPLASR